MEIVYYGENITNTTELNLSKMNGQWSACVLDGICSEHAYIYNSVDMVQADQLTSRNFPHGIAVRTHKYPVDVPSERRARFTPEAMWRAERAVFGHGQRSTHSIVQHTCTLFMRPYLDDLFIRNEHNVIILEYATHVNKYNKQQTQVSTNE